MMKDFVSLRVRETVPWQVPITRWVVWPGREGVVDVGRLGRREGWISEAGESVKAGAVGVGG